MGILHLTIFTVCFWHYAPTHILSGVGWGDVPGLKGLFMLVDIGYVGALLDINCFVECFDSKIVDNHSRSHFKLALSKVHIFAIL